MSRREFSKKTKRQALARADGRCEARLADGSRCPCALQVGRFVYDHIVPDRLGGEPTLENCQVQCTPCDKAKYPNDRRDIDHNRRMSDRHAGIYGPKRPIQSQGFRPTAPQRSATTPTEKWVGPALGRRSFLALDNQKDA